MPIPKMQFVHGSHMWFSSYKNNVLDTRKIVTDESCCHNMPGEMSKDLRHSFDISVN